MVSSAPITTARPAGLARLGWVGVVGVLAAVTARPVLAHPPDEPAPSSAAAAPSAGAPTRPDDEIPAPPPTFEAGGVTVEEHLGRRIPLDAAFRTQDGTRVTLGEVLRGDLPTILTFNYSDCPMLCSIQLNGLTAALPKVGELGPAPDRAAAAAAGASEVRFQVGAQFRIVTIDLEPHETLEKARAMRDRYLARLPEDQRDLARAGWTFLVAATAGDERASSERGARLGERMEYNDAAIHRVADAVGFRYTYVKDRAEWAHPAALILLSSTGMVTRYLYGIEFDPMVMRESIYKAGIAEPATAVGFMLRCYHYDPGANSHARAGVTALRVGAAGFVVLLFGALGAMHFMRRGKRIAAASNGVT